MCPLNLNSPLHPKSSSLSFPHAVLIPALLLVVLLFSACSTTAGTTTGANNSHAPLANSTQLPTPTAQTVDATPTPLGTPPASATDCSQVAGFGSAGTASAGANFSDLSFPNNSVSVSGTTFTDVYDFQIINVCSNGTDANSVRNFFANNLPAYGWGQSTTYPYHGNVSSSCGDPYCWRKANGVVRYISLESVSATGSLAVYSLRLATAPTPSFNMVVRYNNQNVPQGVTVSVTATCGSGEQMVGGGYWVSDSDLIYEPGESYPSAQNAWTSAIQNNSPQAMTLWSYAECIQANYPLDVTIVSNSLSLSTGGFAPVAAKCSSSMVATGGGFRTSDPGGLTGWVVTSAPGADLIQNAWTVNTQAKFGALTETAYVLCASPNAVSSRITSDVTATISPSNWNQELPACNSGEYATDGGFIWTFGSEGNVFYYGNAPSKYPNEWITNAYNRDSGTSHTETSSTFCVTPNPVF